MDVLYQESGEVLEQCGCPIPRGVQGQIGWCPGQPGLVLDMEVGGPDCGRGLGLDDPWGPVQSMPFCDSMPLLSLF